MPRWLARHPDRTDQPASRARPDVRQSRNPPDRRRSPRHGGVHRVAQVWPGVGARSAGRPASAACCRSQDAFPAQTRRHSTHAGHGPRRTRSRRTRSARRVARSAATTRATTFSDSCSGRSHPDRTHRRWRAAGASCFRHRPATASTPPGRRQTPVDASPASIRARRYARLRRETPAASRRDAPVPGRQPEAGASRLPGNAACQDAAGHPARPPRWRENSSRCRNRFQESRTGVCPPSLPANRCLAETHAAPGPARHRPSDRYRRRSSKQACRQAQRRGWRGSGKGTLLSGRLNAGDAPAHRTLHRVRSGGRGNHGCRYRHAHGFHHDPAQSPRTPRAPGCATWRGFFPSPPGNDG